MTNTLKQTILQIYESIRFALESVIINKVRTLLSLLGITIGIFAIISVYTAIDALEKYTRDSLADLNVNLIYIDKWPWTPEENDDGVYKWWKFMNRPEVTELEFQELQEMMPEIKTAAIITHISRNINRGSDGYKNVSISGGTEKAIESFGIEIAEGRAFTPFEYNSGSNNIVLGHTIAQELFKDESPINKRVKIGSHQAYVIGVIEKEGESSFRQSWDEQALVTLNFSKRLANFRRSSPTITVAPEDGSDMTEFMALLRSKMRTLRRLSPMAEDNFALNSVNIFEKQFDSLFKMINLAGGIIGMFSILVGGFGIANIMFVSVRERTGQIGIQKALGAKPYSIMLQFTFEAILLSIIGGLVGLFLIWILTFVVSAVTTYEVALSVKNISIGLGISSVVGAISGIFPAYSAATMDPVEAINRTA